MKEQIDKFFGGDSVAYSKKYYEIMADMPNRINADIVGHFDLLTKFTEKNPDILDIENKEYKNAALEALHAVREKMDFFEVNTGAISRGHRTTPYPASFILDEMKKLKCKLVLTSDCHNKKFIDCHFNESKEYLKSHGFDSLWYLTKKGFVEEKI
jgi:histidinol-phosphatase (PHP family)